jgi:hypothetical protein
MGYSEENGYVPVDIETILISVMNNINTQFEEEYTYDTFVGTNFYKNAYAIAQRLQEGEVKTSEIFAVLQQYFIVTNARISRPAVTPPGMIEALETAGYTASVKPMELADAGLIHICIDADDGDHAEASVVITSYANLVSGTDDTVTVNGTAFVAQTGAATPGTGTFQAATDNASTAASLALQINEHATVSLVIKARVVGSTVLLTAIHGGTAGNAYTLTYTDGDANVGATVSGAVFSGGAAAEDDYDAIRLELCTLISNLAVGGCTTVGTESEAIVLSNGQSFDFKYNLPVRMETHLRLTLTLSENNQVVVGDPDDTKALLLANIAEKYRLGKNFEPQRYFTVVDAPWAAIVLLEWSHDAGSTWSDDVYDAEYDELFECSLANVTLVEA